MTEDPNDKRKYQHGYEERFSFEDKESKETDAEILIRLKAEAKELIEDADEFVIIGVLHKENKNSPTHDTPYIGTTQYAKYHAYPMIFHMLQIINKFTQKLQRTIDNAHRTINTKDDINNLINSTDRKGKDS